jgi:hypothetical protein
VSRFPAHLDDDAETPVSNESGEADDDTGSSEGLSGYYPPPPEPAPPDFLPSSSISVAAAAAASVSQGTRVYCDLLHEIESLPSFLSLIIMKYSNSLLNLLP